MLEGKGGAVGLGCLVMASFPSGLYGAGMSPGEVRRSECCRGAVEPSGI